MFVFQLVGERQPAACQHPKPDFIKADGIAKFLGQGKPVKDVRQIKGDDQAVIGHFGLSSMVFCGLTLAGGARNWGSGNAKDAEALGAIAFCGSR